MSKLDTTVIPASDLFSRLLPKLNPNLLLLFLLAQLQILKLRKRAHPERTFWRDEALQCPFAQANYSEELFTSKFPVFWAKLSENYNFCTLREGIKIWHLFFPKMGWKLELANFLQKKRFWNKVGLYVYTSCLCLGCSSGKGNPSVSASCFFSLATEVFSGDLISHNAQCVHSHTRPLG